MIDTKEHATLPIEMYELLEIASHRDQLADIRRWQADIVPAGTTPATFRGQIQWLVDNGYLARDGRVAVVLTRHGRVALVD